MNRPPDPRRLSAGAPPTVHDLVVAGAQLGRPVRGLVAVGHRCRCGHPDVIVTAPRLADGTPFPTTFYLTCPRLASSIGTLEASGVMRRMTARLGEDPELAGRYREAHDDYLRRRAALGDVPELAGASAGGMPERVKCLHVMVAHALVAGPGINPFGDEALAELGDWWAAGPCIPSDAGQSSAERDGEDRRKAPGTGSTTVWGKP